MTVLSPAFLLLAIVLAVSWFFGAPAISAVKRAEAELGEDGLKTFRETYARPSKRADMPARFAAMAAATDRARRVWLSSAAAVIASLLAIVFIGQDLGLGGNR